MLEDAIQEREARIRETQVHAIGHLEEELGRQRRILDEASQACRRRESAIERLSRRHEEVRQEQESEIQHLRNQLEAARRRMLADQEQNESSGRELAIQAQVIRAFDHCTRIDTTLHEVLRHYHPHMDTRGRRAPEQVLNNLT